MFGKGDRWKGERSDFSSRVVDDDSVRVRATHEGWRYPVRSLPLAARILRQPAKGGATGGPHGRAYLRRGGLRAWSLARVSTAAMCRKGISVQRSVPGDAMKRRLLITTAKPGLRIS